MGWCRTPSQYRMASPSPVPAAMTAAFPRRPGRLPGFRAHSSSAGRWRMAYSVASRSLSSFTRGAPTARARANAPGMSAYPNATWGAELKVQTTERTYVHGGVYNGDIEHTHELHDHGLDWSMRGPVFLIGEVVYQVNQKKDDPQYPGNYKFGMWFDGHSYQDFGTQVLGSTVASLGFMPRVR